MVVVLNVMIHKVVCSMFLVEQLLKVDYTLREQNNYMGNIQTHGSICAKFGTHNLEGLGKAYSKFQIDILKNGRQN